MSNGFPQEHLLPLTCVYPRDNFKEGRQILFEFTLPLLRIIVPTKPLRNIKYTTNKNSSPHEWLVVEDVSLKLFIFIKLKFLI
jgi:hypothetical protein